MALTQTQVSQLYVAIFNRASEGEGNKYWQTNQPDMATTANVMLDTPDAKAYFGSSLDTNQAFIELIYKNTLNKTATDDPDGIAYWVKELDTKSRGDVVASLVTAVADYKDSTDAKTKAAYDQFTNRVEVSNYTAEHLEKAPTNYKNDLGFDAGLTVTNDASTVTSAESIIDDIVQTANAKVLSVQPDNLHGTAGDDLFDGSVVQNSINGDNVNTFTSSDRIDGGTGNDTLIIQQVKEKDKDATTIEVSGAVSNVENIKFTAFNSTKYDMSNTTGVKDFLNQNSVEDLKVIGANEMNVGIKNINAKSTVIEFDGTVYGTTTDSTTLTLENVTNQADVTLDSHDSSNIIETLNVVSKTANNKIDLGGSALKETTNLVITGDKDLSMDDSGAGDSMAKITTVDASAFTGALDLDLRSGGDVKLNITGGTGDDKVYITNFNEKDVVDLGDGKDLLAINLTKDVSPVASLKNIEQMSFRTAKGNDNDDYLVNLGGATELEEIYIENEQNGVDTVSVKKVSSTIKSVNFVNHDNKDSADFDNLVLKLADDEAVSSLDVNFGSIKSPGNPIPVNMTDNAILTLDKLTANGIENMTINTANLSKDNNADKNTNDSGLAINNLNNDALVNLTINGDAHVNIANALADTVKTVDASSTTAGVNLNLINIADSTATGTASTTVTTGSGADTLMVNDGVSNRIKTNAGNDVITFDTDTDTTTITNSTTLGKKAKIVIDAGDGNDTIDISSITSLNSTKAETDNKHEEDRGSIKITAGDGIDTIKINSSIDLNDDNIKDAKALIITDFTAGVGGDNIILTDGTANGTSSQKSFELHRDKADVLENIGLTVSGHNLVTNKYNIYTDGSDTGIYDGDGHLIVVLAGIDNVSDFNDDNFVA